MKKIVPDIGSARGVPYVGNFFHICTKCILRLYYIKIIINYYFMTSVYMKISAPVGHPVPIKCVKWK
jgi:hypothetical protein